MTVEEVVFANPRGQRLAGTVHRPPGRWPGWGVVVAHGMLSSRSSEKHGALAAAVAREGGAALRFDFSGRGDSDGDPVDLTVTGELADLAAAAGWLRDRGVSRLGLVGSSLGGTVALLHAADDAGVAALVTVAAPARLPTAPRAAWGGSARRLPGGLVEVATGELIREGFFADARQHDPLAAASRVACPWLIIHGALDDVVPAADGADLAAAAPRATIVLVPEADHRSFSARHLQPLVGRAREFLRAHLLDRGADLPLS